MPYQVSFKSKSGKSRILTTEEYINKPEAQKYAEELNKHSPGRNARVVVSKIQKKSTLKKLRKMKRRTTRRQHRRGY